jgi:hypothetical protein
MGNRVRAYIGIVIVAMVAVNLLVLLSYSSDMVEEEEDPPIMSPKGWDSGPDISEEPIVIHEFESDPAEDDK